MSPERLSKDITRIEAEELMAEAATGTPPDEAIDVLIGGPPCQAFARVGRAKLREVHDHPTAFRQDPRGNLYLRYLDYVERLQPLAILMENVPDVINYGGHNLAEETCEVLTAMEYICRYTLLNTVYYGVPQARERMFLLAYARELEADIAFPEATLWFDLPRGYEGSRQVALKHVLNRNGVRGQLSFIELESPFYVETPRACSNLLPAITAAEALSDLPPITSHLDGTLKRGARHFDDLRPTVAANHRHTQCLCGCGQILGALCQASISCRSAPTSVSE